MDSDLDRMTREELIAEVKKLRQGIRQHRDSDQHELCWHHPELWGLLPERTDPVPVVPAWPQFMQGCVRYRQSLDEQAPDAPRMPEPYRGGGPDRGEKHRFLETALYVEDLERSARFYQQVLGLKAVDGTAEEKETWSRVLRPLSLPGGQVLLLFRKGATTATAALPGGTIPPHDGSGRLHLAFAVPATDLDGWRERVRANGVPIEGEMTWPRGGTSLYFRDPDGHLVELATPGLWSVY